jgi:hypothetical protein
LPEYSSGEIPTTPILILRFPDGDAEFRTTRGELPVGSRVRARGTLWRVQAFRNQAAILVPVDEDGATGHPPVSPNTLGDMPLIVEMTSEV